MVIVTNTSKITKGNGEKLIERFNKVGKVEFMEGFLGLEVLLTENTKDFDEVTVVTRWNTKDDFKNWTKSSAFRDAHSKREVPEYILENKISFYEVKVVRGPLTAAEAGNDSQAQAQ
ncbi:heme oxygenase [Halalkalibacterium halodurans]|jgi:heme oxygenase (staphylobilin-producing)|uniref:Heme-degrading monooxygenase n=2 Tax=Halalkalibacterium halodurans TaxID=86665 RepID=HDOX_HALH5|nr:heme oxygenase [Halalkalibacterium halodurans]Q9K7R6.1 RecName: Full=Heme-degrading monooxygenase; AltName: Full=Heme oxygenase; AltName: Full=Iron-regulated surface determinant; AltName: Full=Iron-responsive surface determinant [Halalkalibacterium halodurans C-125]MDY7223827.1 heme oxygenase [Halalkalibacterium halodurans]MDY7243048.1 heme oxygenase [Halalkalibacterium halodurans]MED4079956.1 heme oxygenase [Halalkalibacterium halodurans]MED4084472.1 heme oxygenase [Halalkalibacterium halo